MSIDYAFIRSVLEEHEGRAATRGYVPQDRSGKVFGVSGVTIGTGLDLGQQSAAGLKAMGVPPGLIELFTPYLGLKKEAAKAKLAKQPLQITSVEAASLDKAVQTHYIAQVEARYNRDLPARPFLQIPHEAQAVLVSLLYQRGLNSPKKYPNTWQALLAGDWPAAAARLGNAALWDGYQQRRAAEGKLIEDLAPGAAQGPEVLVRKKGELGEGTPRK